MNQNDGESCVGVEACSSTRGKPLNKYRQQPEDEVCKSCAFFPTKPEAIPEELIEFVSVACELSELERGGAKFDYPTGLSPLEWTCLRGLTRGRERAESLKQERERVEARLKKKKDALKGNG